MSEPIYCQSCNWEIDDALLERCNVCGLIFSSQIRSAMSARVALDLARKSNQSEITFLSETQFIKEKKHPPQSAEDIPVAAISGPTDDSPFQSAANESPFGKQAGDRINPGSQALGANSDTANSDAGNLDTASITWSPLTTLSIDQGKKWAQSLPIRVSLRAGIGLAAWSILVSMVGWMALIPATVAFFLCFIALLGNEKRWAMAGLLFSSLAFVIVIISQQANAV